MVSTRRVDARVRTGTTYTAADKGVPIYWANGSKVADDYEDFYDGDWDEEANARNQIGNLQPLLMGVWTGSGHDGTELFEGTVSRAFGQGETGYGTPGSSLPGAGPLYSGFSADSAEERPLYGLSLVLRVAFPVLASSVDNSERVVDESAAARSQRFTTGGNLYGYELESIAVNYTDDQLDRLSAALYTVDAQGHPGTLVAPLAAPSVFGFTLAAHEHRFAAPPGTVLDHGGTYAVVFRPEMAGTDVDLYLTGLDSEDPDGQADWSIADTFEVESAGSWQADADGRSLQIEVRGTVRTGVPGQPTGLGATKLGRYRIDLSWTAPAFDGNLPITGYRIEASPDGVTDWTDLVLDTGSTDTADTHTPLAPSTTRHYRVSAINSAGTGDPSGSADATTDPNTPPAFTVDAANVSVPENTPANTNISGANRTATDPDGDSVTYSFQTGGGVTQDYQSFNIDSGTGQVKTRSALDHEAQASYEVSVIATDIHGGIDTIAYSIAVGDADEPPAKPDAPTVTATPGSTASVDVSWAAPANTGKPPITGYDLQYRQGTSGNWTNGPQNVDTTSASIPGLDGNRPYDVQVRAKNDEGNSDWSEPGSGRTANNAPVLPDGPLTLTVPENTAADTNIGAAVGASDADSDPRAYTLEGPDAASFAIVETSGQIRVQAALDFEATNSYSVTVRASDGTDSDTVAVTIDVTDVDEPPVPPGAPAVAATPGTDDSLDVAWTAPANAGKPAITSYDLHYRPGTSGNWIDGPQDVATTSAAIPDLSPSTSYQVEVRATNAEGDSDWSSHGTGSTSGPLNSAPTFANPTVTLTLLENTTGGVDVGSPVAATDADTGDTLTYSLGGPDVASFAIVTSSGQIRTRSSVTYDFENKSSYSVSVTVTDQTANASASVTINLIDAAEPPAKPDAPTVTATPGSTDSVDVSWAAPANTGKPPITGYDLQYRQGTSGNWTNGPQNVDTTSASIPGLNGNRPYDVQVRAKNDEGDSDWSDPGSGRTANNAPVLAAGPLTLTVPENTAADIAIGAAVGASDADSDPLTYTLEGADDASFAIVETSGQIRVQAALDFEATNSYSVTVRASDGTDSDTVAVTIDVTDVDEPPVPPGAPAVAATPGTDDSLDVAWAAPANAGKPAITSYDLHYRQGTAGNWIDGPQDVATTSAAIPDLSPSTSYQVEVRATNAEGDSDWSSHGTGSTSGPLNSAPTFANPTVTLTLLENTPAGTNVGSPVAATDADTGDTLTYSLGGLDVASFAIVTSSGQIRTRDGVTYDFENKSSYSVSVTVTDQTANASASVTINLSDAAERPVPPGAPAVAARPGTDDSLDVSWTAPANAGKPAITSYDLHYRPGTSGNWINGTQNVVVTNAVIPSLSSSTSYQVEVRATNADGDSGWSDHGTGSTGISLSVITQVMGVGVAPGNAHLVVRWMAVDTATGYKVQWKSGVDYNTGDRQATVTSGLTTRYRIPNLTNGTEYTVRVIATRAGINDGPPSAEVTATPDVVAPPPPPPPPQENNFPTADAGPDQSGLWEGALVMLDGSGSSHPEDDPLRYRWNQLSGEPVALSSQNVVNPSFTAPQGLTADAVLSFRLLVTDPSGGFDSDTVTITVEQGTSPPLTGDQIYYFPHLAVGEGWQTTITYINYSSEQVNCRTEFLSDQGSPLMVSFAERGTVLRWTDTLPPGGSVHQETNVDLSAPLARGWARGTCSGPLKASLLFRWYNSEGMPVAEAGVNAARVPATRFVTFAEQGEGRLGTGVAYANPSDTAAVLTFTAKDADGEVLASVDETLLPNGHGAQNMAPLFGLSSFSGSLEVASTAPIVSLSLNFEAAPVFSSLPPGELDAAAQGSTTYYFPHLAVGASWQTTITYINYSPQEVSCQTDFLSDHGSPLMVSFAGRGTVVSRTDVLPPGGSVHQETNVDLSAPLARGWARATCSGPLKASLLYRRRNSEGVPTGEAGVNATTVPATRFVTFAEQGEGKYGSGVAYANPSDTAALITFTARDADGRMLASVDRDPVTQRA